MADHDDLSAREMIRIYGGNAEAVALSQLRKFAGRGDQGGARTWGAISQAINRLRLASGGGTPVSSSAR